MAKKFNLQDALKAAGFKVTKEKESGAYEMSKTYTRTSDVVWYGKIESSITVTAFFAPDGESLVVHYKERNNIYKIKDHLADKRAYNAMKETVEHRSYQFEA